MDLYTSKKYICHSRRFICSHIMYLTYIYIVGKDTNNM